MGTKIAVVGGGSTYTPELVEGFVAPRRPPARSTSSSCSTSTPSGSRSSAGSPGGCSTGSAGPGRLHADRRPRRGDRRRRLRPHPAAGRRPGRPPRRRDAAPAVRRDRPGDDRRRRLRQGAADRARSSSSSPSSPPGGRRPDAWIVDFTNPVGIVTQALIDDGHRAIGLCNVAINLQRRFAARFGVDAGAGRARARRAQPPDLGAGGPRRRRRPAARAARRARRASSPRSSGCPVDMIRTIGAIPSYYLRYYYLTRTVLAEQRAGHTRAARRHGHRGAPARDVPRPDARREAGAARRPRRRVLQRGRGPAHRVAPRRRRRHPGRRRPQRRGDPGPARRRPWSRSRRGSIATAPTRCRSRRWPRSSAGWSRPSRPTRS